MEFIEQFKTKTYFSCSALFDGEQTYVARCVDIYDGDTLTVIIKVDTNFYKIKIRIYGIDTCEIKSHNVTNKQNAIIARDRLFELLTNQPPPANSSRTQIRTILNKDDNICLVTLISHGTDKYGRLLCDVLTLDTKLSVAQCLLNEKLAYPYFGKTKKSEETQETLINNN